MIANLIFVFVQDIYRHAYHMLGSLLNLKHEFPVPAELFSGSIWTAMYMVSQDDSKLNVKRLFCTALLIRALILQVSSTHKFKGQHINSKVNT